MKQIVGDIAVILLVLAFVLFMTKFKKNEITYKIFTIYLGIISVCEISSRIAMKFVKNNLPIGHFDNVAQFVLLSYFFYTMMKTNSQRKILIFISVMITIVIVGRFVFDPSLLFVYNNLETFSTAMVLIIYSAVHLYNLLNQKKKFYYITTGLLIYLVGSTTLQLTRNIFVVFDNIIFFKKIMTFNNLFYLSFQIFVLYDWFINFYKKSIKA